MERRHLASCGSSSARTALGGQEVKVPGPGGHVSAPAARRCGKHGCLGQQTAPPRPVFIKSSIGVWQMSLSLMLPGWEVCFPPPPPLPPSPHCPPIQWQDGETVGHACEWVATRLGGPKQGHPLVMPHGVVLTQPTACSGRVADRAISSLAPSVTF